MATTDILSEIQTINATITGITSAPTDFPAQLNSSDLPMALAYPEVASYSRYSVEGLQETRTWYIRVYVLPIAQGRSVDEGFARTVVFIDRFRNEWYKTTNQKKTDWRSQIQLVSDSGVRSNMTLHNAPDAPLHWGVEFELSVIINHDIDG